MNNKDEAVESTDKCVVSCAERDCSGRNGQVSKKTETEDRSDEKIWELVDVVARYWWIV